MSTARSVRKCKICGLEKKNVFSDLILFDMIHGCLQIKLYQANLDFEK